MAIPEISVSQIAVGIFLLIFGGIITYGLNILLNRRSLFTYQVTHNQIGMSSEHELFGDVKITWGPAPVSRLYFSTVTLTNQSLKDFDNVTVRIFGSNTELLTERTKIDGTFQEISFTKEYGEKIYPSEDDETDELGYNLWVREREYLIPVVNRGQKMIFSYLHEPTLDNDPDIFLEILHKGIKCKFSVEEAQLFGVPQSTGLLTGVLISLIFVGSVTFYLDNIFLVALFSFFVGIFSYFPGAYAVKFFRKIRELVTD